MPEKTQQCYGRLGHERLRLPRLHRPAAHAGGAARAASSRSVRRVWLSRAHRWSNAIHRARLLGLRIDGVVSHERQWTWEEFHALPFETVPCDIHCVTKWSKLGTSFGGVSVDTLLEGVEPQGSFAIAYSYGGYTTNLALADLTGGKAWVATEHEGEPLAREHGGPARLLVPHLYFWKSAKWVAGLRILDHDEPGFWEKNGYHNRGDPWQEERYWSD
ncbi:MAG TPA: molybdopterin-dependent oxidoreductase [Gaiellaceae bacterium]|nr:molybdopterin-dependent oxidoreductase [Gaiellaceae bacterium]